MRGSSAKFNYAFNIKDHLGNIRLTYGMNMEKGKIYILEENHYYPFGMKHEKYNSDKYEYVEISKEDGGYLIGIEPLGPQQRRSYQYKYNGKEFQDELGLNFYDYGARNYDPALGRWMNIDPLAEKYPNINPYSYTFNDPINHIDPDGRDGIRIINEKNKTITIRANYYVQTENRYSKNSTSGLSGYTSKEIASMQKDYNEYLNDLNASVSEGEYSGYTVKFDLQFKEGGSVGASEQSAQNDIVDGHSIGNSFSRLDTTLNRFKAKEIDNGDGTITPSIIGGVTSGKKNITMNTKADTKMNRIHEIFHTLGLDDFPKDKAGIMNYPPEKPNQKDINSISNGSFLPIIKEKENE